MSRDEADYEEAMRELDMLYPGSSDYVKLKYMNDSTPTGFIDECFQPIWQALKDILVPIFDILDKALR